MALRCYLIQETKSLFFKRYIPIFIVFNFFQKQEKRNNLFRHIIHFWNLFTFNIFKLLWHEWNCGFYFSSYYFLCIFHVFKKTQLKNKPDEQAYLNTHIWVDQLKDKKKSWNICCIYRHLLFTCLSHEIFGSKLGSACIHIKFSIFRIIIHDPKIIAQ